MALINHPSFHKYFTNTSWLLVERILRMGVNLFVGVYVARYLGPEQFGQLSYAISFISLFSILAVMGLDNIVIRELVKGNHDSQELLGTSFFIKLFGALLALLLVAIIIPFTSHSAEENLLVFIIATGMIFQSTSVIDFYFQAKVQSKYVVRVQIVQLIFSSVIRLVLVWGDAQLLWFAAVVLAECIIFSIGLILVYILTGNNPRKWSYSFKTAKVLLQNSWPLFLSGVAVSLYMKIDQVMIKEMLDAEAVGYYVAAVRISEAWYFIPMIIAGSLFPALINVKEESKILYYQQLQKLFDVVIWLAIAIALSVSFIADWIVIMLFGKQYLPSSGVLIIHIWAGVFVFLGCILGRSFVVENNQNINFYRNLSGLITNILLNIMLIPMFGIKGAAISTLISHLVSSYLAILFFPGGRVQFILASQSLFPVRFFMRKRMHK